MKFKYKTIDDYFKDILVHAKIDQHLIKNLKEFRLKWATKSPEYIDFLGSGLLGIHEIRFSLLDDDRLMSEVLKIKNWDNIIKEYSYIESIVNYYFTTLSKSEIKRFVSSESNSVKIANKFKIGLNPIYQILAYLAYSILNSNKLSKKHKEDGIKEICLIMQYKMFSSIYGHYFKFTTSFAIANTTYNKLSYKFLIKQLKSWQAVFDYRVENCNNEKELNYKRIHGKDIENRMRLISDIQIKLKEQIKHIYTIMINIIENNETTIQDSSTYVGGEHDEEQLSDVTTGISTYIIKAKQIVTVPNDFIDNEAIKIASTMFNGIDEVIITKFLRCMSDTENVDVNELLKIVEDILTISFTYLQRSNINVEQREYIPRALSLIKNYWSASKVKNEDMEKIKG